MGRPLLGIDDERAVEAKGLLSVRLRVRVIEERSGLLGRELISKGSSRLDRRLSDLRGAIHRIWHHEAMPVNGRRLGERVAHDDADVIPLHDADGRTGLLYV